MNKLVEVCDKCLRACCWHGEFMCDESRNAGTIIVSESSLKRLNREHPDNWSDETSLRIFGTVAPHGYARREQPRTSRRQKGRRPRHAQKSRHNVFGADRIY